MTEAQIALARRAVAAPGWRWMPGMAAVGRNGAKWRLYMGSGGVLCAQGEGDAGGYVAGWSNEWAEILGALPGLSDPLTALGLLALVRERWDDPTLCVVFDHDDGTWAVGRWEDGLALRAHTTSTETEALIAALEVAP